MSQKIGLVYLNRNAEGSEPVTRFVESYKKYSPGIAHEFITIYKGFSDDGLSAAESLMDGVAHAHRAIRVDDAMTDIDSYLIAAKAHADIDAFCFLNTFSEINCDNWLLHLSNALQTEDVGIVGASASYESLLNSSKLIDKVLWFCDRGRLPYDESFHSQYMVYIDAEKPRWIEPLLGVKRPTGDEIIKRPPDLSFLEAFDAEFEDYWDTITAVGTGDRSYCQVVPAFPNPHIRSNAFMIRREHLLPFCHRRSLMTKIESYLFESGWHGLTRTLLSQGLNALVVNADGDTFELQNWPKSRTFRMGGQQKLMVHDNQTRKFDSCGNLQRMIMAHMTWGSQSTYPSPPVSTLGVPFLASNLARFKKSAEEHRLAETDVGVSQLNERRKLIRPRLHEKIATSTITASIYFWPGTRCSQRFKSPKPNMRAVSLQMVTWGQTPSAYVINWKLISLSGATQGIVSEGQIRAEELYDWVIIGFFLPEPSGGSVGDEQQCESQNEFELVFEVAADAIIEIPAGLPLFQAQDTYDNAFIVPTGGTHADEGVFGLTARFYEFISPIAAKKAPSLPGVTESLNSGPARVRHLYALLLGRAPDSEGAQFYGEWCNSTAGSLRAWKAIGLSTESKNRPGFASRMLNTLVFALFSDTTTVTRQQKQALAYLPEHINEGFSGIFAPERDVVVAGVWVGARVTLPVIARPGEIIELRGSYFPGLVAKQTGSGESKLDFFVDGELLHSVILDNHGDFDVTFLGPAFCCSERASLVIQCNKSFVPNLIDSSTDTRKLSWRMKSLIVGGNALVYSLHPDLLFPDGESIAVLDEAVVREAALNLPYAGFFQPESDLANCGVWVSSKLVLPVHAICGKTLSLHGTYFPGLIEKQTGSRQSVLKFSVDGEEIHSVVLGADGDFSVDFQVSRSGFAEDASLTIECSNVFIPKSIGVGIDSRRLSWRMKSLTADSSYIFDCATHIPEGLSKIWFPESLLCVRQRHDPQTTPSLNSHDPQADEKAVDVNGVDVPGFYLSPPLNFAVWPQLLTRPHINVLLPSHRLRHMSGGPNTALLLAAHLAKVGEWVRIIATDAPAEGEHAALYPHMDALFHQPVNRDRISLVDGFDRTFPIEIGANDIFLATAWWTAQMVKSAIGKTNYDQFIYLIQDFESILHEGSTFQARALETYGLPHIPVINTRLLLDHMSQEASGCYADPEFIANAMFFEPAIDRTRYFQDIENAQADGAQKRRVLLFYARPTVAKRNLYEIGLVALRQAVASRVIDNETWEVWAMGEKIDPVPLGNGVVLNPLPWMNFDDYAKRVRTADLMLSLMLSPHPSYPPLEMAASGKFVVTNSFSVKTAARMQALSPNIIVAAPTPDSIAAAVKNVVGRINARLPSADPTGTIDLPSSWNESLGVIIPKLMERIALLRRVPASRLEPMSEGYPVTPLSDYEFFRKRRLTERRANGRYAQEKGLLSFVTSAYNTNERFLEELAVSIFQQDGGTGFEWFILDNGSDEAESRAALSAIAKHPCVRMERVEKNLGIIGGMRYCLERASGRYILPLDSDDIVEPDCVHIVTRFILEAGYPALLYTDEDKFADGRFSGPYFKPDWDPVLFVHSCYIAHLCAIDRAKAVELGFYSNSAAEGCHDWDSFLKGMNAGYVPVHIPEVLYSWRMHHQSTSGNIASKSYISDSHRATLRQFLDQANAPHVELTLSPLFKYGVDWWYRRKRIAPQTHVSFVINISGKVAGSHKSPHADSECVFLFGGISTFAEILNRSESDLVHIRWSGIEPDDDEWLWDAMGLIELFPDTVIVGGTLHDGTNVLDGPRVFGFGDGFDCPDRDRPLSDPGFSAQMWKPHSVSAISGGHFVVRRSFLRSALVELIQEQVPLNLLATWLCALAREGNKRVLFSPFMRALTTFVPEDGADHDSKRQLLSRFWHLLPETRLLSPRLGLTPSSAYTFVSDIERQQHLKALFQQRTLAYPDALAMQIRRRASKYPLPVTPITISILTPVYAGSNIRLLDDLANSINTQTHRPTEWVIVVDGPMPAVALEHLREQAQGSWGATLIIEPVHMGIMGATLQCLKHAKGQYVVPVDADDLLTIDAIQILSHEIDRLNLPDFIYSDEDLLIEEKPAYPYLRPDFDSVLNLDSSYIWHLAAINRATATKLGLYTDSAADWCHDWDSVMRIWNGGGRIEHVNEILYHWRQHRQSTTNQSEGDPRSLESVRHVLEKQILRTAQPELYAVEPWPYFRGMKELYIARKDYKLPKFVWVGDLQGDSSPRHFKGNEILVVTSGDVVIDAKTVYREVVRLVELHPNVAAVGGRVLGPDDQVLEGCFIANSSGALVAHWDGCAADDAGSYALALKTQSVEAAGPSLAFFKLQALHAIGCPLPEASVSLPFWVADTCKKIRKANWHIAFSPLVNADAMEGFSPHGRDITNSARTDDHQEGTYLPATENTPHFVGTFDSRKNAVISSIGEVGYLVYGPYLAMRAGKYVAAFTITGTGNNGNEQLGEVDVNGLTSAKPENQINVAKIFAIGSEQIIPIPFIVDDRNVKFEFRVQVNGTGQVEYKGVRITKIV